MLVGYSDIALADSAISITNKNERVKKMLGDIRPIDKLTMLEGYISYSKDLDSVFMALTIKGNKGKAKLDVYAFKNNTEWKYERGPEDDHLHKYDLSHQPLPCRGWLLPLESISVNPLSLLPRPPLVVRPVG